MLDEVQTGQGRTGKWFAFQHGSSRPDVVTLAKGLANGIPLGACLARGNAAEVLHAGMHGSTFGGNPFACTVANAVIDAIDAENLVENAAHMGAHLQKLLREDLGGVTSVKEIRGRGMMIGIEIDRPCADLVSMALDRGLLINVTADRVVRLLPPLNMRRDEVEQVATILSETIRAFHNR
jgi:acetylornithine aminotransferase